MTTIVPTRPAHFLNQHEANLPICLLHSLTLMPALALAWPPTKNCTTSASVFQARIEERATRREL